MTIVTTLQSLKRTFEDKRLIISSSAATTDNNLSRFKNISFVCEWGALVSKSHKLNTAYDNNCCFSHLVGLPLKQGQPQPMFEWQKVYLFDNFNNHKYNWVKKATGILSTLDTYFSTPLL
jgi:hypothetical protein